MTAGAVISGAIIGDKMSPLYPHKDNGGFQPYVVSESNPYTKAMKD